MSETNSKTEPIAAEARDKTAHVSWDGIEFDVPRFWEAMPFKAAAAFEEGRVLAGIRALLPDAALRVFEARNPTNQQALDLWQAIQDALGVDTSQGG